MWLGTAQGSVCQAQVCTADVGMQAKPTISCMITLDAGRCHSSKSASQPGQAGFASFPATSRSRSFQLSTSGPDLLGINSTSSSSTPDCCAVASDAAKSSCLGHYNALGQPHTSSSDTASLSKAVNGQNLWDTHQASHLSPKLISAFGRHQQICLPSAQHADHSSKSLPSPALAPQSTLTQLAHDGPVSGIVTVSDRVVSTGGARVAASVMREWSLTGELIASHTPCKQGLYRHIHNYIATLLFAHVRSTSACMLCYCCQQNDQLMLCA